MGKGGWGRKGWVHCRELFMKRILVLAVVLAGMGCQEQERTGPTMRERQDAALADPWKYSPHDADRTDISGGGIGEFKKDAFKRDMDSVFNP